LTRLLTVHTCTSLDTAAIVSCNRSYSASASRASRTAAARSASKRAMVALAASSACAICTRVASNCPRTSFMFCLRVATRVSRSAAVANSARRPSASIFASRNSINTAS